MPAAFCGAGFGFPLLFLPVPSQPKKPSCRTLLLELGRDSCTGFLLKEKLILDSRVME